MSEHGISAADAYHELDRQREAGGAHPSDHGPERVVDALRDGGPGALASTLSNDLETAAIALLPELARTLEVGRELGALAGLVSGSGPTCAFLAEDAAAADSLAGALAGAGVCRATRVVSGPVPGARLVR
jgi:4-diphosphocytidyl-2-C-methyl-D-erythritol kinase